MRQFARFALVASFALLFPIIAAAAPPKFAGDVWAGSDVIPASGLVNIYWVFDAGVFHEYVYYYRTDEIRPITSGRYTTCESNGVTSYTLTLRMPRGVNVDLPSRESAGDRTRIAQVTLTAADGHLTFPHGERIARIDAASEFVAAVEHPQSITANRGKIEAKIYYQGCCGDCYAVHEFFGISFLNGICCSGGCDGGGGSFGGGGATGGW